MQQNLLGFQLLDGVIKVFTLILEEEGGGLTMMKEMMLEENRDVSSFTKLRKNSRKILKLAYKSFTNN